jgi:hypothetical protein
MEVTKSRTQNDVPIQINKRIMVVEQKIEKQRDDLIKCRIQDRMVNAHIREELDFQAKIKKEDCMSITGMTSKAPMPSRADKRKTWLRNIVRPILNSIEPNSAEHIVFSPLGRNKTMTSR